MQPSENRSNHSSVSTFLAPATACGRAARDAPVTTGEKRMSLGSGWVVAALFLVPLSSVSGQRTTRALSDPVLRPGSLRARVVRCPDSTRSEEHTSELQSQSNLVCRLLLEKK